MNNDIEDIELTILPNGDIEFSRSTDEEYNANIMEILHDISPLFDKSLKEFFDGSKSIKIVVGDETFCG